MSVSNSVLVGGSSAVGVVDVDVSKADTKVLDSVNAALSEEGAKSGVNSAVVSFVKDAFSDLWHCTCIVAGRTPGNIAAVLSPYAKLFKGDSGPFLSRLGDAVVESLSTMLKLTTSGQGTVSGALGIALKAGLKVLTAAAYIAKYAAGLVNGLVDEIGVDHTDKKAVSEKIEKPGKDISKFIAGVGLLNLSTVLGAAIFIVMYANDIEKEAPKIINSLKSINNWTTTFCKFAAPESAPVSVAVANIASVNDKAQDRNVEVVK